MGGGGGESDPELKKWLTLLALGTGTVGAIFALRSINSREISWKEFVNSHLAKGNVERLVVVNKKWVRVETREGAAAGDIWFTIGSVDTFERNLESAQVELQMDPAHFVPVLYKSELELASLVSSLPTLLLLGFLFYSFRRAGSMMSGMASGRPGARRGTC
jgi:AFG3 family protein